MCAVRMPVRQATGSVTVVKLTVQVKLLPTPVQAAALEETLHACNQAATWVSQVAFEKDIKRNFPLREHTYKAVKDRWRLGGQAAQHVIKKTCDAYTHAQGEPEGRKPRQALLQALPAGRRETDRLPPGGRAAV